MLLKPEKSKSFVSNKEIASVIINLALVAKSSACLVVQLQHQFLLF